MNGRMYDAVVGRMLSADRYVQDATNSQDYNRYSYVRNNPLKYTDPSGWRLHYSGPSDNANDGSVNGDGNGGGSRFIGNTPLVGTAPMLTSWGTTMLGATFYAPSQQYYTNPLTGNYMFGNQVIGRKQYYEGKAANEGKRRYNITTNDWYQTITTESSPNGEKTYIGTQYKIEETGQSYWGDRDDEIKSIFNFSDGIGQALNAGGVFWGGSELGLRAALKYNIAGKIAEFTGDDLSRVRFAFRGTSTVLSKVGKVAGTVGYVVSATTIATQLITGQKISTASKINFGISSVLYFGAFATASTVAAPFVAGSALLYGGAEFFSFMTTRKTIEEHIFKP